MRISANFDGGSVEIVDASDPADIRLRLRADSDAFIVRGLIAILLALFDDRAPADVLAADPQAVFARIGLDQQLSMGRRNGLHAMVARVRALAAGAA